MLTLRLFCLCSTSLRRRPFSSQGSNGDKAADIGNISLSQSVPWIPPPKYATIGEHTYDAKVSTLENGLQVATENKFGEFCTIGGKVGLLERQK